MNPFVMATDALFFAPGSEAAVYLGSQGQAREVRVIRSRPDEEPRFGRVRISSASEIMELRKSDVAAPTLGSLVKTGFDVFAITTDPLIDVERLTWSFGVEIQS